MIYLITCSCCILSPYKVSYSEDKVLFRKGSSLLNSAVCLLSNGPSWESRAISDNIQTHFYSRLWDIIVPFRYSHNLSPDFAVFMAQYNLYLVFVERLSEDIWPSSFFKINNEDNAAKISLTPTQSYYKAN